ncbi:unnamed protein product (macronuclear) [Paramecium tetraurelia]|uniref:Protein kinase domain-containing protein n=1 Tax=Paramecium tetraurelia TaxID=5888 RepID=A0EAQ5_PARTE|nr:uncharacterized protein GSPATT00025106001 [Paramecium tetraurelia]CAK92372.1 unnamed protein product [Paramecium tetraurelia]|eukprot:XP_001459769.1 hypothetical protein (macronuclear) [Paramecium tetraurelia strain d4-2]
MFDHTQQFVDVDGFKIDLSSEFGHGAFSRCYRCKNPDKKMDLCVKIIQLSENSVDVFSRETEIVERLLQTDCEYLQVEKPLLYLYGILHVRRSIAISYQNLIKSKLFNNLNDFINLGVAYTRLKVLYQNRIIHRDIKPANIFFGNNGTFQLADYGAGRILDNPEELFMRSGIGTPIYAAPQVYQGENYTNKCDVYSLGVVIYEIVYSKVPIFAASYYQYFEALKQTKDKKIQITDFPKNIFGMPQEKEKLYQFLSQSLIYEESSRISWEELFEMFPNQKSTFKVKQNLSEQRSNATIIQKVESQIFISNRSTLESDLQSSVKRLQDSSLMFNKFISELIEDQEKKDISVKQIDRNDSLIQSQRTDNILQRLIECYLAKCTLFAERLFIKNNNFLDFLKNNENSDFSRPYVSRLYYYLILLSGYQFSSIFNVYNLVFQNQKYWDELEITQKKFVEKQIELLLQDKTEDLKVQKKFVKQLYIQSNYLFKDQRERFKIINENIILTFIQKKYQAILFRQNSITINIKNNLLSQILIIFEDESEFLMENNMYHLAYSIDFFKLEEKYDSFLSILDFDYKKVVQLPDDKESLLRAIKNYFKDLKNQKH